MFCCSASPEIGCSAVNDAFGRRSKRESMKTRAQVLCGLITALFVFLLLGSTSQAASGFAGGNPWQIGDIIVCVGGGTCNVLRIVNGTPTLLDQFSDGLLGDTRG